MFSTSLKFSIDGRLHRIGDREAEKCDKLAKSENREWNLFLPVEDGGCFRRIFNINL